MALIPLNLAPKIQIWIAGDYASVLFSRNGDAVVYAYDVKERGFVSETPTLSIWMLEEIKNLIDALYEEGNGTYDFMLDAHHAEALKWLS